MRLPHRSRAVLRWSAAACAAVVLAASGPASAQVLPAAPARADSVRADTLRAVVPPLSVGLPRVPMADPAPAPDSTAPATPAPMAAPALPRVELVSTARPVVLVRGAGAAQPAAPPIESARVQVDAEGRRTLVYSERPAPPRDVGSDLGCGPGAERAVVRLGNLSTDTLFPGDEGPLVGAAQQLLCVTGYAVPMDGRFDVEMAAAVLAFQSDHNATAGPDDQLVVTGTLDGRTRRVLEDRARARLSP